ncbi:MAG: iolG 1, partial [Gammaproteobacteria bacterium]|nr:iolG 1 [Gammaproteobacteria bacterium]
MTGKIRSSGHNERSKGFSRRAFGKLVTGAAAVLSAGSLPLVIPVRLLGAEAPSNRLRIAQIGCGRIAQVHDVPAVLKSGLADYVAVSDLDSRRMADSKAQVEAFYRQSALPAPQVRQFSDYRDLLSQPDLDAVVISTPDHWHAQVAAAAVLAGKDVYVQKPFTMTVAEGILLRDLIAKTGRIVQVGSQQRSTAQFRFACELVRSGRIGAVR